MDKTEVGNFLEWILPILTSGQDYFFLNFECLYTGACALQLTTAPYIWLPCTLGKGIWVCSLCCRILGSQFTQSNHHLPRTSLLYLASPWLPQWGEREYLQEAGAIVGRFFLVLKYHLPSHDFPLYFLVLSSEVLEQTCVYLPTYWEIQKAFLLKTLSASFSFGQCFSECDQLPQLCLRCWKFEFLYPQQKVKEVKLRNVCF